MVSKRPSGYQQVFAIVRYDRDQPLAPNPGDAIVVKKIVWSQDDAESEVKRLNVVNGDKGCVYFWMHTRLDPQPES